MIDGTAPDATGDSGFWRRAGTRLGEPQSLGSLAGVMGAGVALAFGELIEGATETIPSLVIEVGDAVIDNTPGDVSSWTRDVFGTAQKPALVIGTVILTLVFGALLGRLAARGRPGLSAAGFAAFGVLGGWAAAHDPQSPDLQSWIVALVAAGLAVATTNLLISRAGAATPRQRRSATSDEPASLVHNGVLAEGAIAPIPHPDSDWQVRPEDVGAVSATQSTRRSFFAYAAGTAVAALGMVGIGRSLRGTSAAEQARDAVVLPTSDTSSVTLPPASTVTAAESSASSTVPPGSTAPGTTAAPGSTAPTTTAPGLTVGQQVAALDTFDEEVRGITTYVTPNDNFYKIDTALRAPQVNPADWKLSFKGMVDNPYELTFDEILAMDLSEHVITLSCVSNSVGGGLVGNAVWTGVPLSVLLDRAGVQPGADQVVGRSVDNWTAGFPTPFVYDGRNAILAVGMNGEALPIDHGFPARLVVAGLYGYVSAVKWIKDIELHTWDGFDGYWVPRGWSKEGPMKTQSRIDVPRTSKDLMMGRVTPIAGIAWAPTRGIRAVEVNIDGEGWQPCELGEALGDESWVQWRYMWTPTAGDHRIQVRATDGDGVVQSEGPKRPAPDGAEGWHEIDVHVSA